MEGGSTGVIIELVDILHQSLCCDNARNFFCSRYRTVMYESGGTHEIVTDESDILPDSDSGVTDAINRINAENFGPVTPENVAETVAHVYDSDRLSKMRQLLEEHNLRIIQQLLSSDTGALSPREVAFRNEGLISDSTVRDHLRHLVEIGLAEKLEPNVELIPNRMPRTFYAASPLAIKLLKEMGLWNTLRVLYQIYSALDRPDDIEAIENWSDRPSPDWL